jgi:hypothetical protein
MTLKFGCCKRTALFFSGIFACVKPKTTPGSFGNSIKNSKSIILALQRYNTSTIKIANFR